MSFMKDEIVYRSSMTSSFLSESGSLNTMTNSANDSGLALFTSSGSGSIQRVNDSKSPNSEMSDESVSLNSLVLNEKVQTLAKEIYQQLEMIVEKFDPTAVENIMPVVVKALELLDLSYTEVQELEVEVELFKEDNSQLVAQYEREKHLRKSSDQRLIELEDNLHDERKEHDTKVETITSILKMLELKAKNNADQLSRFEDREAQMKQDYATLHERYTDLFKTHMESKRRSLTSNNSNSIPPKNGNDETSNQISTSVISNNNNGNMLNTDVFQNSSQTTALQDSNNSGPISFGYSELESMVVTVDDIEGGCGRGGGTENGDNVSTSSSTLNQGGGASGSNYGDGDSNISSMGKEVENLIAENNELLATKHALNVVKDDLIARLDQLTGELDLAMETVESTKAVRANLEEKIEKLESDLSNACKELEDVRNGNRDSCSEDIVIVDSSNGECSSDLPISQRKRFTRLEMARVLMERNQYKEKYMELQEAVRWTEMLRVSKSGGGNGVSTSSPKSSRKGLIALKSDSSPMIRMSSTDSDPTSQSRMTSVWKFFTSLFTGVDQPPGSSPTGNGTSSMAARSTNGSSNRRQSNLEQEKFLSERITAYGWSVLPKILGSVVDEAEEGSNEQSERNENTEQNSNKRNRGELDVESLSVPVPVCCIPITDEKTEMKVWCATPVNIRGGVEADGSAIQSEIDRSLISESHVWICTSTRSVSKVCILDLNSPSEILETFAVCSTHLLSIAAIPGITQSEYDILKEIKSSASDVDETEDERACSIKIVYNEDEVENENSDDLIKKSLLPTIWLGSQTGHLYIYSAYLSPKRTSAETSAEEGGKRHWMHKVKLDDAILSITHAQFKTFVSLANGCLVIFERHHSETHAWNTKQYTLLNLLDHHSVFVSSLGTTLGGNQAATYDEESVNIRTTTNISSPSIRCVLNVCDTNVWVGFRADILVIDISTLEIRHVINVTETESTGDQQGQVRQMVFDAVRAHVYVTCRQDAKVRVFHSDTRQHIKTVDVESDVTSLLGTGGGNLGGGLTVSSFVRLTALHVSNARLWIGTGNGVILSLPLPEENICDKNMQISFHGHRDSVKFFICTPGSGGLVSRRRSPHGTPEHGRVQEMSSMLVMSGGEGYIDFRKSPTSSSSNTIKKGSGSTGGSVSSSKGHEMISSMRKSYLIVWQIPSV